MIRSCLAIALLAAPSLAAAQSTPAAQPSPVAGTDDGVSKSEPPKRIRSVTLTGNQTCPEATSPDEVVVCARVGEPFRIPKQLRNDRPIPAKNQSWVNRTATLDAVGRVAGGLPNTCSPVGTGGQTGCSIVQSTSVDRRPSAPVVTAPPPDDIP